MQPYSEFIRFILLLGLGTLAILWIAYKKGFFVFPSVQQPPAIGLKTVLVFFGIYLGMTLLVGPFLIRFVHLLYAEFHGGSPPPLAALTGVQLIVIVSIVILFFLYGQVKKPHLFNRIWKNWSLPSAQPVAVDIGMGFLTWFIAFPLVALVGEIADMFLYICCNLQNYEQVAVRYLKTNLTSFETMIIPLFIILLAAPMIEEFLFRGCLQTLFKKWVGMKGAIFLSSICFALFHFSASQGIGNVSLLLSLFTFALFLGFIYERQGSLFASIALHITFNSFSTIRILFFPE